MFVKKGDAFLGEVSLKKLEDLYLNEQHVKAKMRLQCAVLRKKGKSQPYVSEVTGLPVMTVSGILRRFEKRGIQACYAKKQKGQVPKLKPIQKLVLKKSFVKNSRGARTSLCNLDDKIDSIFY